MAPHHDDSEEEGSLPLPDHIGKELGFVGRHKGETKSRHLIKAEKVLLEDTVTAMTLKVGCMQLNQDAKARGNKKASDLVSTD